MGCRYVCKPPTVQEVETGVGGLGRGVVDGGGAVDPAPPTVNRRSIKALITESGLQLANSCMDRSRVDRFMAI